VALPAGDGASPRIQSRVVSMSLGMRRLSPSSHRPLGAPEEGTQAGASPVVAADAGELERNGQEDCASCELASAPAPPRCSTEIGCFEPWSRPTLRRKPCQGSLEALGPSRTALISSMKSLRTGLAVGSGREIAKDVGKAGGRREDVAVADRARCQGQTPGWSAQGPSIPVDLPKLTGLEPGSTRLRGRSRDRTGAEMKLDVRRKIRWAAVLTLDFPS